MNKEELITKLEDAKNHLKSSLENPSSNLTKIINEKQLDFLQLFIEDIKQLNEATVERSELIEFLEWYKDISWTNIPDTEDVDRYLNSINVAKRIEP